MCQWILFEKTPEYEEWNMHDLFTVSSFYEVQTGSTGPVETLTK
jgi:hypothetical protein